METHSDRVVNAKTLLLTALGENSPKYLANLKMWFRQKWTKEQFDAESRKLLASNQTMHLHNQFFLAILNKIDSLSPSVSVSTSDPVVNASVVSKTVPASTSKDVSKKRKRSSRPPAERVIFEPADIYDYLPNDETSGTAGINSVCQTQRYAAQELFLPDVGLISGRLMIAAWETGLTTAEDTAAEMIVNAVQVLLKNILTAVFMRKKHYRVTGEGSYVYDVGHPLENPFIRNSVSRKKIDDTPIEIDKEITLNLIRRTNDDASFFAVCEEIHPVVRRRITVVDIYHALCDKNVIPSQSVYSLNIERISNMLC